MGLFEDEEGDAEAAFMWGENCGIVGEGGLELI